MTEQTSLYEVQPVPKKDNSKRCNWERAFQKWSDTQSEDGTEAYGSCGWGAMCDYCDGDFNGKTCVRALNDMCRDNGITINYDNRDFEKVWCGEFV